MTDQRRDPLGAIGNGEPGAEGPNGEIQLMLRNINPDKASCEGCHHTSLNFAQPCRDAGLNENGPGNCTGSADGGRDDLCSHTVFQT
jgi:hypothetical protein